VDGNISGFTVHIVPPIWILCMYTGTIGMLNKIIFSVAFHYFVIQVLHTQHQALHHCKLAATQAL
jgi:hypothetical protein